MQRLLVLTFVVMFAVAGCFSQSTVPYPLSTSPQNSGTDCSDPSMAATDQCNAQSNNADGGEVGGKSSSSVTTPVLTNPPGSNPDQYTPTAPPPNPSQSTHQRTSPQPQTEFEQLVADSVGRPLPLFGQSLFQQPPSTFSPIDSVPVPSDYIVGPGDELQIDIWGQITANLRVTVDRSGQIYIPQVGQVAVAGIHYGDLEEHLKREILKVFKNFNLTVNIGRLRSIQIIVVGNARYPGTYTIGSLSTLVNAIFASGGPTPHGSLRHIQVRRDGTTITDFDFYDLLIKGDKSKDVRLESGDVLYIPHIGPLVAISGSVNVPAIYEMKDGSHLQDLIDIAGDLSTVADTSKITIDRVADHQARKTLEFPYDEQSRSLPLNDGDIVRVFSIVPRFEDTVTLRGNVANPGRYPWKAGMRITDLIPDAQALLTRGYWRDRAAIVSGSSTEYPIQKQVAQPQVFRSAPQENGGQTTLNGTQSQSSARTPAPNAVAGASSYPGAPNGAEAPQDQSSSNNVPMGANDRFPDTQSASDTGGNPNIVRNVAEDLRRYAPEINWDYAIVQRVNPQDLSSKLVWINPRKAIIEHDEKSNIELLPGDIVTIFSQRDIAVPQTERSRYVIIEGEVKRAGVYKLEPNETLRSVLLRAGGLVGDAYIYGSRFTRESARIAEQKSLDELAHSMEVQIRQSAISIAASSQSGDLPQMQAAQQAIIAQLRNTRASGRIALPLKPTDKDLVDFPDMVLEDGDRLSIPHTPSTVSVVGDVYNPGSFIFDHRISAGAYLDMAGKGKPQSDLHHAFLLRANGVVVAANTVNGLFTGAKFDRLRLYPGDQIVVPYKLPTGAFVRGLRDWTQISSQLAITAAALAVIAP